MTIEEPGQAPVCGVEVQRWDFHWQRVYFYAQPPVLAPGVRISVSCDDDTTGVTAPGAPGWGSGEEMCTAIMFLTTPISR